jgi:hypothetical protein
LYLWSSAAVVRSLGWPSALIMMSDTRAAMTWAVLQRHRSSMTLKQPLAQTSCRTQLLSCRRPFFRGTLDSGPQHPG